MKGAFRSLGSFNYRVWFAGSLISYVGTWMQRIAQDWLVLTQLTEYSATALGVLMALQYGPVLVLLPFNGLAADRLDRRKLLIATRAVMGVLALALGLLTLTGVVQVWHVYVLALLLGCTAAFDAPASHTFVSELAGEEELASAVGLNSAAFSLARLIGPAISGVLIAAVGSGWVFMINAASFAAAIATLGLLRVGELHHHPRSLEVRGGLGEGFRYVWRRADQRAVLLMLFLVGTFGFNFQIFISTMSVTVFQAGADRYGLLMSMMGIGAVAGALLAARSARPGMAFLLATAALFGAGFAFAAIMPTFWLFGLALIVIGVAGVAFTTVTSSFMQLASDPDMRGRVIALRNALGVGGTPIGAPIVGWVADTFGPRAALVIGAAAGLGAAMVGLQYLVKHRNLRVRLVNGWPRIGIDDER